MARYTTNEAAELLFEDQLFDSGDECEIEEDPAFPLPHELELEQDEPLPQTSLDEPLLQTSLEMDLDLSRESSTPGICKN